MKKNLKINEKEETCWLYCKDCCSKGVYVTMSMKRIGTKSTLLVHNNLKVNCEVILMYTISNLKAKMYVVSSFKIKHHPKCLAHLTTESSH